MASGNRIPAKIRVVAKFQRLAYNAVSSVRQGPRPCNLEEICVTRLTLLAELLDSLSATIGKYVSWLALFMVLAQFALVLSRYVFGVGFIALQESIIYSFALLLMLGAADT